MRAQAPGSGRAVGGSLLISKVQPIERPRRAACRAVLGVCCTTAACPVAAGSATTAASQQASTSPVSTASSTLAPSTSSSMITTIATKPTTVTTAAPTQLESATCYYTAELDKANSSTSVAFGFKEGDDNVISVKALVDACHDSLVRQGKIGRLAKPMLLPHASSGTEGSVWFPG